jgi:hypothetical protein
MGRQVGLIKIKGNIGGVSFYKSDGQDLARVANGPSKEKIQNDPNFVRTRENNSEFGGSATVAKSLRLAFASDVLTMGDNKLVSRLTALFKEICSRSTGVRGQRPIELSANKASLEGLEFNKNLAFGSVFNAPYTITTDPTRTQADVSTIAFNPQTYIHAPAGATHFRVSMTLSVVSDYLFNTATGKYEATDAEGAKLTKADAGLMIPINSGSPVTITLSALLPGAPTIGATVSVVLGLGIDFYQQVGSIDYHLAQGNAMKIVKVF